MMAEHRSVSEQAKYVISVAAELAGVHPQTLRVYERKGLVNPQRTAGNTRRYSERDIQILRRIQELTQEGVNLAGVMRIMELDLEIERLEAQRRVAIRNVSELEARLQELAEKRDRHALLPLKDVRRVRRALKTDVLDEAGRRRTFPSPPARV
jgi:MerR family transcriptional regulator/heat shock protein HspR